MGRRRTRLPGNKAGVAVPGSACRLQSSVATWTRWVSSTPMSGVFLPGTAAMPMGVEDVEEVEEVEEGGE